MEDRINEVFQNIILNLCAQSLCAFRKILVHYIATAVMAKWLA